MRLSGVRISGPAAGAANSCPCDNATPVPAIPPNDFTRNPLLFIPTLHPPPSGRIKEIPVSFAVSLLSETCYFSGTA
ncbi:MAG: hypothetical protein KF712_07005 [Akkermansiaceae bacterium]|nr:hypothetical protein [Akkermansiaceae bacterium]